MNNDNEMFSMSYEEAKDKYGVGVGNAKYFMSKEDFEKKQKEIAKPTENKPTKEKEQSLVAEKFGNNKKAKTWNDVKSENENDPVKIANYLNNATDYTPGNLTKKGMEEFGYSQGEDGKWLPKKKEPTTNGTNTTNVNLRSVINNMKN